MKCWLNYLCHKIKFYFYYAWEGTLKIRIRFFDWFLIGIEMEAFGLCSVSHIHLGDGVRLIYLPCAKLNTKRKFIKWMRFFIFFYINGKKYWFRANFRFLFLVDLHILGCPERDFTISGKCLFVCVWQKFYGKCSSRSNAQNLMIELEMEAFGFCDISLIHLGDGVAFGLPPLC